MLKVVCHYESGGRGGIVEGIWSLRALDCSRILSSKDE